MSLIPPCPPILAQAEGIGYHGLMIRYLKIIAGISGATLLLTPVIAQETQPPAEQPVAETGDAPDPEMQEEAEAAAERERDLRRRSRSQSVRPLRPGASALPPPSSAAPMPTEPEPGGSGPKESFAICPGDPRCPS